MGGLFSKFLLICEIAHNLKKLHYDIGCNIFLYIEQLVMLKVLNKVLKNVFSMYAYIPKMFIKIFPVEALYVSEKGNQKQSFFNLLSPHDAIKHHFISMKTALIFL